MKQRAAVCYGLCAEVCSDRRRWEENLMYVRSFLRRTLQTVLGLILFALGANIPRKISSLYIEKNVAKNPFC